jgi:hypothetical protein
VVTGVIEQLSDTSVEIVELPIHKWTETYKEFLESCIVGSVPVEKDKDKEKEKEKKSKVPERFITVCTFIWAEEPNLTSRLTVVGLHRAPCWTTYSFCYKHAGR